MKAAHFFVATLLLLFSTSAFSQNYYHQSSGPTQLVVAHRGGCLPVLSGPSGNCQIVGQLMPQAQCTICQVCEKVTSDGTVWAKVQIRGWVQVRCNGQKKLRRLMNRDHDWAVAPAACHNPPVICSCPNSGVPICKLTACSVVQKTSVGLPKCNQIEVCFSGWVVKRCAQGVHMQELTLR